MVEHWIGDASAWCQRTWSVCDPYWIQVLTFLSNPWARAAGLIIIVYFTIRVIASVYSGDKQNSQMGPVGIRPHVARRLDRDTIMLPRLLMPMNMDGVSARLKLFYAYANARGKRCKQLVYVLNNARIAVTPSALGRVQATVYGQEVPDVATADVCFPAIDMDRAPEEMPATPDRAIDYVRLHNLVESWHEDDNAPLISMHAEELEQIKSAREDFIVTSARRVALAREGNSFQRWIKKGAAERRPNVIGSYYIKLEFSHDPWFVLTKHPDRDLKMTAWLTVLTSMFALAMDAWPKAPSPDTPAQHAAARHDTGSDTRPVSVHTQRQTPPRPSPFVGEGG